jgi:hypothetical protein
VWVLHVCYKHDCVQLVRQGPYLQMHKQLIAWHILQERPRHQAGCSHTVKHLDSNLCLADPPSTHTCTRP